MLSLMLELCRRLSDELTGNTDQTRPASPEWALD
jgi:hypothetical protein